MQINVSGKHMTLTPPIEEYAVRKAKKFSRYYDRIQQIDVVIGKMKNGYEVEMLTDVERHEPFVATSTHEDLYAAIDVVADRSIRQLTDHKEKLRNRKHPEDRGGEKKP